MRFPSCPFPTLLIPDLIRNLFPVMPNPFPVIPDPFPVIPNPFPVMPDLIGHLSSSSSRT